MCIPIIGQDPINYYTDKLMDQRNWQIKLLSNNGTTVREDEELPTSV